MSRGMSTAMTARGFVRVAATGLAAAGLAATGLATTGLATTCLATASALAQSPPIIAGFEMNRQREDHIAAKRDPKAFWASQIVRRIEDKRPPRTKLPSGRVVVHFVVGRDGSILSKDVATSSGQPSLDRLAMEMVERAAPFPPMPDALSDDSQGFDLPLRFK